MPTTTPTGESWTAPRATGPVRATVALPGSKSMTNRALVLAALATAPTRLVGALRSRDTALMAAALRSVGAGVSDDGADVLVEPATLHGPATVDVGNAGTVMRFFLPLAALASGDVRLDGDPRSHERPLGPVIDALRALGAAIDDGGRGRLPLTVQGAGRLAGGEVSLDASTSSQFVSALLLAAPRFDDGLIVRHIGPPIPSAPHLAMTVGMLRDRGARVDDSAPNVWRVEPGPLTGGVSTIEPDLSNAAPFLAAAVISGGQVTVPGWPTATTQAGDAIVGLLEQMGGEAVRDGGGLTMRGTGTVRGIDVDLHDVGELAPTIAAVAALACGPSTLRGIAHLRGHETDRLSALAKELTALGGDVTDTADGLVIHPRPLHGGLFATYEDHRLATAAAILGLVVPGIVVENVGTTAKTLPGFTELWDGLLR